MSQLFEEISRWATSKPEMLAYSSGDLELSYGQLFEKVELLSNSLADAGLKPGSLFAFQIPSGPDFIVALLVGLKDKLIVAPIADTIASSELSQVLEDLEPEYFLRRAKALKLPATLLQDQTRLITDELVLHTFNSKCCQKVVELCPEGACIRYTSGTTGLAKGVLISAASAHERVVAAETFFRLKPGDRVATFLAMPYHFIVSILHFLRAGACVVRPKNSSPSELVRCFEEDNAQVLYAAPFHFDLLVGGAKKCPQGLRLAISTSTSLRQETALRFSAKFEMPISDSYGIIEVGIPISLMASTHAKWGSIGSALPGYEACVYNENGYSTSGRGTLMLRGLGMFDAYLKPFTSRAAVLKGGWFETGDLAEIDSEGRIIIYGRKNSAIHIAGFKVFPEEIESVLLEHKAVSDAQVLGVQHPTYGNTIHARIVVSKETTVEEDSLSDHCRTRLGNIKTPHSFEFTQRLERTSTGKLKRS